MKCVFLIERINYYRAFAPLIKECVKRGHTAEIWHNYDKAILESPKKYLFPEVSAAPEFVRELKLATKTYASQNDLVRQLTSDKSIRFVFSQDNSKYIFSLGEDPNPHFTPVNLMIPDSYYDLGIFYDNRTGLPFPKIKQIYFHYSQYWKEGAQKYYEQYHRNAGMFFSSIDSNSWEIGCTEQDPQKLISPEKVRNKYGIPEGKDIFLYLGFPFYSHKNSSAWEKAFCGLDLNLKELKGGFYSHDKNEDILKLALRKTKFIVQILKDPNARKLLSNGMTEKALFREIRNFCDRNNLFLVVKPRLKFPVNTCIQKQADLCIWDDETQQDPPILRELFSISRVLAGYLSMGVLHAAHCGVYSINIRMPEYHYLNDEVFFPYIDEPETPFRFDGIVRDLEVEDFIKEIKQLNLQHFRSDQVAIDKYRDKFFSTNTSNLQKDSSERAFDVLESKY